MKSLLLLFCLCAYFVGPFATAKVQVQPQDLLIDSNALSGQVYVKAWIPGGLKPHTGVIVFLHGRGYTRALGESSSMIEDMGLQDYLNSEIYQKNPHIILAPQDNFVQSDTDDRGQDYWVGADGRNWENFLSDELPTFVRRKFALENHKWKIVGVSMGAHGAMKMAVDYPKAYAAFASISPIFRSTLAEIPEHDQDVFVQNLRGRGGFSSKKKIVNNMGYELLAAFYSQRTLSLPPHFIKTHKYDFGLDPNSFPSSTHVWRELQQSSNAFTHSHNSVVAITAEPEINPGGGHSMAYWRIVLPEAMDWLIQF